MTTYDGARSDKRKSREVQGSNLPQGLELTGGERDLIRLNFDAHGHDYTQLYDPIARILADRLRDVEAERDKFKRVCDERSSTQLRLKQVEAEAALARVEFERDEWEHGHAIETAARLEWMARAENAREDLAEAKATLERAEHLRDRWEREYAEACRQADMPGRDPAVWGPIVLNVQLKFEALRDALLGPDGTALGGGDDA